MIEALLQLEDLRVAFGGHEVVHGVDFSVQPGEVLAVVGESGSGKSVTALALLGLLSENAEMSGSARFRGRELLGLGKKELRAVRGAEIALISQDPIASLNPVFTIGFQVVEAVRAHDRTVSRREARERALDLLRLVEIPEPEIRLKQYPHQLSGGQCQRIGIAMALASDPALLIADEPTTALDVTIQAEVLEVLSRLGRRENRGVLLITHDMGVVADLADRVVVMRHGHVVEQDETVRLFSRPADEYTRHLLTSVPRMGTRSAPDTGTVETIVPGVAGPETAPGEASLAGQTEPALEIKDLTVEYGTRMRGKFKAVEDISLSVRRGQILGLVGESGSGKSTIGKATIGIAPMSSGSICVEGTDLVAASRSERRAMRRRVGVVFQNPALSLNPRYTAWDTVTEPLRVIGGLRGAQLKERAESLFDAVGMADRSGYYPHELSGGQRQRVAIARAVTLEPALLIADEPTSALDVSVQSQVLDIFRELQQRLGFACVFISHDLAVVDELCDSVAVLYRGQIVEQGVRSSVLENPQHEYTQRLLDSVPLPDPVLQRARRAA